MASSSDRGRTLATNTRRLRRALARGRTPRVVGFDDGPFERGSRKRVPVAGVVCAGTRFEGLLWGHIRQDGVNATRSLVAMLAGSKFLPQVHLVLLDGIALGGFNVVDLPRLADELALPCVAVMRTPPDRAAVRRALGRLSRPERRWATIEKAGPIHQRDGFVYQCVGATPELVGRALRPLTDTGHVPEALRLAHLITSAVVTGESGRRA